MPSRTQWHPVTPSQLLRAGDNVVPVIVMGQPLALWRSAAGQVQAWEDRCPHRGVALSLGRVQGDRLACAYHGWEYAAESGRCVAIPALPELPVPGRVCVRTFTALERQGMVWVNTHAESANDPGPPDDNAPAFFLRSIGLHASIEQVEHALTAQGYQPLAPYQWRGELTGQHARLFCLSATADLCLLHLTCASEPATESMSALFAAARMLRSAIEAGAA